jgi:hypothetical protein
MSDHTSPGGRTADDERDVTPPSDEAVASSPIPFDVSPPDEDTAEAGRPQRAGRGRLVALGSLLALGLVGAAVVGTAGYRIASQKDATLSTPDQIGVLRRDDSQQALGTAEYLRTALSAEVNLDDAIGAVYTDSGKPILLFGGTTLVWTPEKDLDTAFELMSDDAGTVTDLHDVPAGDLGGSMKCGTSTSPDGNIAVCGWADHGSLALAMFPNRAADEAGTLLVTIRNAVQSRA